jgi:ABC-type microcin C transport system duplicated ATPase subunit YejF
LSSPIGEIRSICPRLRDFMEVRNAQWAWNSQRNRLIFGMWLRGCRNHFSRKHQTIQNRLCIGSRAAGWFSWKGVCLYTKRHLMVNGVSLRCKFWETFRFCGRTGCGNRRFVCTLLRLIEPMDGEMWFEGQEVTGFKR